MGGVNENHGTLSYDLVEVGLRTIRRRIDHQRQGRVRWQHHVVADGRGGQETEHRLCGLAGFGEVSLGTDEPCAQRGQSRLWFGLFHSNVSLVVFVDRSEEHTSELQSL